jgi:TRAP-type mannitol/chloroaromatic compound transport system substrate-binding protein
VRKKTLSVLLGIALVIIMVFGLLPSCGGGTTPQPTGTGGATNVQPTATGQVFNWRWQSTALAGTPTYWLSQEYADEVKLCSGGRLNLDLQPQGAIVGMMEIFDAAATGSIEVGSAVDCYWQGKDQRFNLIGMASGDLTWMQACCYFYCDSLSGSKDSDALYAKFNLHRILYTISETETEAMSNKKLDSAAAFKGLTWRGAGYSPLIVQEPEFGGSGVILATADVYSSLQTHVIDACEVGNAFSNYGSAYQEVTKYWSFPGIHQLCQTGSFIIGNQYWNQLPADLQEIMKMCSDHFILRNIAFTHLESAKIIPILQSKYGVEIDRESPELQATWKKISWRICDQFCAKLPDFAAMWKTHTDLMALLDPYEKLQTPDYGNATFTPYSAK